MGDRIGPQDSTRASITWPVIINGFGLVNLLNICVCCPVIPVVEIWFILSGMFSNDEKKENIKISTMPLRSYNILLQTCLGLPGFFWKEEKYHRLKRTMHTSMVVFKECRIRLWTSKDILSQRQWLIPYSHFRRYAHICPGKLKTQVFSL